MPRAGRAAFYCAAVLSFVQPLLADSAIQRWLQVVGMDALILLLAGFALATMLVSGLVPESDGEEQRFSRRRGAL